MKLFKLENIKFNALNSSIRDYLSKTLSGFGSNYNNSTIFGQIVNVLSAVSQNILLYIEDALTEQNKFTAQRKKSVYGLAALSGYEPSLGKATGVDLVLSFVPNNVSKFNAIINNHQTLVCNQNGLYYNIILPQEAIVLSLEKYNTERYLYAVQGKFESQSFISTGGKYYTQNIRYVGFLDTDYISVKVNDETWEKCDSVYDMKSDGKQFVVKVNYVNGIDIVFGNDVHGRALQNGDIIYVSYLVHDGEQGNLDVNKATNFIFDMPLMDISGEEVDGNAIFNVTFASQDAVSSGSNSESVNHVRQMIGINSRSLVLASPDNFKNFISKFSFCGYNRTWSEPGSLIINSLIIKNYKDQLNDGKEYFNLTERDFYLSKPQKESIIKCLSETGGQLSGSTYKIFDPDLYKYAMYLYITLKNSTYDKEYIKNQIRVLVGDFFCNIENDKFIPKSDLIHYIKENVNGVDSADIYFLSEKNETAIQTKSYKKVTYSYNPATGVYNKKIEDIYLYDGENPNIGLDEHGNIKLENDEQFPVLMGGWDYLNKEGQEVKVVDPLIIIFQ